MKQFFRNRWVQAVLADLFSAYLKLCIKTLRWQVQGLEKAEGVWDGGTGVVVCFWHASIGLSPACWPIGRAQEPRAMVSLSADGEFIALAMAKLGFPAIRGSAAKSAGAARAKGGAQAFRDALKWIRAGHGIAITPDGPRGPARRMTLGPATLAGLAPAPVLLVGMACRPAVRLNSWDRSILPLPFGRGAIVWSGPHLAPRTADEPSLRALTEAWEAELNDADTAAEALLA